ncbi:hypothetical protein [Moraxella cuniculi]|uniref:hypothetical protein n=1 Tax=Moraxella cuniculi TaxID=34061 RepID=UPI000970E26C|nr:hypothetical protein [Moraxella cuniculi]OOS07434.1 hypothetical protein B0189_03170 [Moraxella cuniculi]
MPTRTVKVIAAFVVQNKTCQLSQCIVLWYNKPPLIASTNTNQPSRPKQNTLFVAKQSAVISKMLRLKT